MEMEMVMVMVMVIMKIIRDDDIDDDEIYEGDLGRMHIHLLVWTSVTAGKLDE